MKLTVDRYGVHASVYIAFVLSAFVLSPNPVWAFVFYVGLAPVTLWVLWKDEGWRRRLTDPAVVLGLVVIAWFAFTVVWGVQQSPERIAKYARAGVSNALFFVTGVLFFAAQPSTRREFFFRAFPVLAAINALVAFGLHFEVEAHTILDRLGGWAETRHEILGSLIMGVAAVVTAHCGSKVRSRRLRAGYFLLLVPQLTFIILSGSRGPVMATAVALFVLLSLSRPLLGLAFMATGGVVVGVLALIPDVRAAFLQNVGRPSYRLEIWLDTLDQVGARPLFGHGVANEAVISAQFTFPHSLYFSALYYGGLVGLALLLVFLLLLVRRAWSSRDRAFLLALLTMPIVGGLFDVGQAIKTPSEEWLFIWLPAAIVAGLTNGAVLLPSRRTSDRD